MQPSVLGERLLDDVAAREAHHPHALLGHQRRDAHHRRLVAQQPRQPRLEAIGDGISAAAPSEAAPNRVILAEDGGALQRRLPIEPLARTPTLRRPERAQPAEPQRVVGRARHRDVVDGLEADGADLRQRAQLLHQPGGAGARLEEHHKWHDGWKRHGGSGQHSGGCRTPACNRGVFPEAHEACQRRRQRNEQHVPRLAAAPRCAASLTGLRAGFASMPP